jgi:arginine repressor
MKNKRSRLQVISEILRHHVVGSQEELQSLLKAQNCEVTQATLSRDLKLLKVAKTPLSNGMYKYALPAHNKVLLETEISGVNFINSAVLSIDFSGQLAVIKTKPGYASAIAWDIDNLSTNEVLGTIAGDDTILVIPREGITRQNILEMMSLNFADKKIK